MARKRHKPYQQEGGAPSACHLVSAILQFRQAVFCGHKGIWRTFEFCNAKIRPLPNQFFTSREPNDKLF